jgi:hypothetical protein
MGVCSVSRTCPAHPSQSVLLNHNCFQVQIVETTSLAEVEPPDFTYVHGLQKQVAEGRISSLQLESVVYAFEKVRDIVRLLMSLRTAKSVALLWV